MRTILLSFLAALTFSAFGQSETRSLGNFYEVSTQQSISVTLIKGSENKADISASGLQLSDVVTEISGGKLRIFLEDNKRYRNVNVDVTLTFSDEISGLYASSSGSIHVKNDLQSDKKFFIDVSSSGEVKASNINAPSIDIEASSSGDVSLELQTKRLTVSASSSGDISASGQTEEADIKTSSSGEFDGYNLTANEAYLSTSSGGSIKIDVKDKLRARASSGGSIRYSGNPEWVDKSSSSGGSIRG